MGNPKAALELIINKLQDVQKVQGPHIHDIVYTHVGSDGCSAHEEEEGRLRQVKSHSVFHYNHELLLCSYSLVIALVSKAMQGQVMRFMCW